MSLEQALDRAVAHIPECVAAGYVDLTTGMLVAIRTVGSHPLVELVITGYLSMAAYIVFKACEYRLAHDLADDEPHAAATDAKDGGAPADP